MSVQYTTIFHGCKMIVSDVFFLYCSYFAQNFDRRYTLEPPQCSGNKGADQPRGYREADLRLCFRISKKPVFS